MKTVGLVLRAMIILLAVAGPMLLLLAPRTAGDPRSELIRTRNRSSTRLIIGGLAGAGLSLAVFGAVCVPGPVMRWLRSAGGLFWPIPQLYLVAVIVLVSGALVWRIGCRSVVREERIGLRLTGVGMLASATGTLVVDIALASASLGVWTPSVSLSRASRPLERAAIVLIVLGVALVAAATLRARVGACRQLRLLLPIWRLMQTEFPGIVLGYPAGRAHVLVGLDDLELGVYRRIIETRDGMLELSRYVSAGVVDDAALFLRTTRAGDEVDDTAACVEACWVTLAVHRRRAGAATVPTASSHRIAGGASVAEEATWLIRVSRVLARSSVPQRFVEWYEARAGTPPG